MLPYSGLVEMVNSCNNHFDVIRSDKRVVLVGFQLRIICFWFHVSVAVVRWPVAVKYLKFEPFLVVFDLGFVQSVATNNIYSVFVWGTRFLVDAVFVIAFASCDELDTLIFDNGSKKMVFGTDLDIRIPFDIETDF